MIQLFEKQNNKVILLDLDRCVEVFNPSWVWKDNQAKEKDLKKARVNFIDKINTHLQQDYIVIAIGERFLTKVDISNFITRLKIDSPIYLFHLTVPFSLRKDRLHKRGPHSLIDLEKDQKERDSNLKWYGYIYKNINTEQIDAQKLFQLIQNNHGLLNV